MTARYQRFNDLHFFRVMGSLRLTFRLRAWNFWTVGLSCYAVNPARDIVLHIGVVSIGVKWSTQPARKP